MTSGRQAIGENYLEQIQDGTKITPERWRELASHPTSIFAESFPFFDDPKFAELRIHHQRFILAYMLKDSYGFNYEQCYRFATRNYETTPASARASATNFQKIARVRYFLDKLDWMRLEALGYSTAKIIEAEAGLSYSDITEYLDDDGCFAGKSLKELPARIRRSIKSFEILEHMDKQGEPVKKYKLQLWDKGASLQRMEKMKGLHKDVVETTSRSVQITAEMTGEDAAKAYQDMMKG